MSLKNLKPFHPLLRSLSAVAGITFVAYCVTSSPEQLGWTGFKKDTEVSKTEKIIENGKEITVVTKDISGKTLWDWLSVLGVPGMLFLLGVWFQQQQQKIAESNQKEEVLQAYFDRLAALLIDKNLIAIAAKVDKFGDETKEHQELLSASKYVIRARTLSILRRLEGDGERKGNVIQFLIEAEVIGKLKLDLSGANLSDAILTKADLSKAILNKANFNKANLIDANLSGASLIGANLSDADLFKADFSSAILINVDLDSAYLRGINFSGAILRNTYLRGINFSSANLSKANLNEADLMGAILINTDLSHASLISTDLRHANLSNAGFSKAILIDADLRDANINGANLMSADLSKARNLTLEQVAKAKLCKTKLPPNLQIDLNRDCKEFNVKTN
jgi:uncharacterized protein YjbI with pentapeptide repeats